MQRGRSLRRCPAAIARLIGTLISDQSQFDGLAAHRPVETTPPAGEFDAGGTWSIGSMGGIRLVRIGGTGISHAGSGGTSRSSSSASSATTTPWLQCSPVAADIELHRVVRRVGTWVEGTMQLTMWRSATRLLWATVRIISTLLSGLPPAGIVTAEPPPSSRLLARPADDPDDLPGLVGPALEVNAAPLVLIQPAHSSTTVE